MAGTVVVVVVVVDDGTVVVATLVGVDVVVVGDLPRPWRARVTTTSSANNSASE